MRCGDGQTNEIDTEIVADAVNALTVIDNNRARTPPQVHNHMISYLICAHIVYVIELQSFDKERQHSNLEYPRRSEAEVRNALGRVAMQTPPRSPLSSSRGMGDEAIERRIAQLRANSGSPTAEANPIRAFYASNVTSSRQRMIKSPGGTKHMTDDQSDDGKNK